MWGRGIYARLLLPRGKHARLLTRRSDNAFVLQKRDGGALSTINMSIWQRIASLLSNTTAGTGFHYTNHFHLPDTSDRMERPAGRPASQLCDKKR